MKPPEDQGHGSVASAPEKPLAVSVSVLARRSEFLKAASARRQGTGGFLLQARDRDDGTGDIRVGFTASKKIGNAVLRNRAKRRLRALARETFPELGRPGWDYVLVARPELTVSRAYADLMDDLKTALRFVHKARP